MKKQLLTLLLFVSATIAFAQRGKNQLVTLPVDSTNQLISYSGVIQVEGATQNDLYLRSREWFAKKLNSIRDVIQMDDREAGKVIGKVNSAGYYTILLTQFPYRLTYTISITSKDGRYRYEISSIYIKDGPASTLPLEGYYNAYIKGKGTGYSFAKKVMPQLASTLTGIETELKAAMGLPGKGFKSKDDF